MASYVYLVLLIAPLVNLHSDVDGFRFDAEITLSPFAAVRHHGRLQQAAASRPQLQHRSKFLHVRHLNAPWCRPFVAKVHSASAVTTNEGDSFEGLVAETGDQQDGTENEATLRSVTFSNFPKYHGESNSIMNEHNTRCYSLM
jgi:hypothetical protein